VNYFALLLNLINWVKIARLTMPLRPAKAGRKTFEFGLSTQIFGILIQEKSRPNRPLRPCEGAMGAVAKPDPDHDLNHMDVCGANVTLLGNVKSPRGVQIMATNSMPNSNVERSLTTDVVMLAYALRLPTGAQYRFGRGSYHTAGLLNFVTPDIAVTVRGAGSYTMSLCAFGEDFLTSLSETEGGLRLRDLDVLASMESERLTYLCRTMFREAMRPGFAGALFAEAMGMEIAVEVGRYDGAQRPTYGHRRGGLAPWQMRRLEDYVHDHLSEELTLNGLAQLLGISLRHLSRVVRQTKGVSVHRWIADCRIREARRLLAETDLPVQEIARRSAFHSASAFATAFRAASDYAPGEFRRLAAGKG
jgi:AraC family transcriptional regulator